MSKLIKDFGTAACSCVSPACEEKAMEWANWREDYVGREGWLLLYESEKKQPGKQFLYFHGGEESKKDWWLKTSCGQASIEDGTLVFVTKNSRYVFRLNTTERSEVAKSLFGILPNDVREEDKYD